MRVKIALNDKALKNLDDAIFRAAGLTIEVLKTDVITDEVMPYNVGTMQDDDTLTDVQRDGDKIIAALITGSIQARRLYFHPEYNFQRGNNHNAGGEWLEPWINGEKKDFTEETFSKLLKKEADV